MNTWPVVEIFTSINGEGRRAGELATFVRFKGCNLACSWCDTRWANEADCHSDEMSAQNILDSVKVSGTKNVTLTGGEPLIQKNIEILIEQLLKADYHVEVETNGTCSIEPFLPLRKTGTKELSFTMDSKLSSSGCSQQMNPEALKYVGLKDSIKFVVASETDLQEALEIIVSENLLERTHVFFSPCYGSIELETIVNFMKKNHLNGARLQIQMHKIIWAPDKRGV